MGENGGCAPGLGSTLGDKCYIKKEDVVALPPGREPPAWAKKGAINCRGRVDPGSRHFVGLVTINGAVTDAIIDTAGARSMLDVDTAKALGLEMEAMSIAEQESRGVFPFGHYTVADGRLIAYAGRLKGPVTLQFGPKVKIELPAFRLTESSEPLVLIGTDIMSMEGVDGWSFLNVGYHRRTGRGNLTFARRGGMDLQQVELTAPKKRGPPRPVLVAMTGGGDKTAP